MPTKGSCMCGDLSYEFDGEPLLKGICHCLTCRKLTSSAYTPCILVPDPASATETPPPGVSFELSSKSNSKPRETTTVHETGMEIKFYGCSKCPSTLYKRAPGGFPGVLIVLAGTLDGAEGELRAQGGLEEGFGSPQVELWVKYRLPWLQEVKSAKQCEGFE
ncbi:hypothetical protein LTR84_010731 [Exophiala bonariae]|uniref:CENP-V/GFA domain-containing protein n=1 Tax=Exophiala bonariae TaxID=1690606 RepID=A0AAV9MSI7_9EURO|nr:hypothetical protein LTR84_010731 [Exophiala bonariae]